MPIDRTASNIHRIELMISLEYLLNYTSKSKPLKNHDLIVDYALENYKWEAKRQRIGESLYFLFELTKEFDLPFKVVCTPGGKYYIESRYNMNNKKILELLLAIKNSKGLMDKDKFINILLDAFSNDIDRKTILKDLNSIEIKEKATYKNRNIELVKKALLEDKTITLKYSFYNVDRKYETRLVEWRVYKIIEENGVYNAIMLPLSKIDVEIPYIYIYRPIDELEIDEKTPLFDDKKRDFNCLFKDSFPLLFNRYGSFENFLDRVIFRKNLINICFYFNKALYKILNKSYFYYFNKDLEFESCKKTEIESKCKIKVDSSIPHDEVLLVDLAVDSAKFISWGFSDPYFDGRGKNVFDLINIITPRRFNREIRKYYLEHLEKYSKRDYMDSTINIIGIGETGKKVIENLKHSDYKKLLERANMSADKLISDGKEKAKYGDKFIVKKCIVEDINKLKLDDINYASIIIYDESNTKLASKVSLKLSTPETLNIGLCINGNNKVEGLNVINVKEENVREGLLSLLDIIIPSRQVLDDLEYQRMINYFDDNHEYHLINVSGNDLINLAKTAKEQFDGINNIDKILSINIGNFGKLTDIVKFIEEINTISNKEDLCSIDVGFVKDVFNSTIIYRKQTF